jgi:excisionase family DNA binding protein
MTEEHPLMTVAEASLRLRISKNTLNNWLSQRKLKRCKMGRKTFVKRTEVESIIQRSMFEENGVILKEENAE